MSSLPIFASTFEPRSGMSPRRLNSFVSGFQRLKGFIVSGRVPDLMERPKMKSDVVPGQNWKGGDFPAVSALASTQTFAKCTGKSENGMDRPCSCPEALSAMIGLTRGSKQSRYSDVIGVLCFGCDKMTSQSSALFMTCSIQNSFSGKL